MAAQSILGGIGQEDTQQQVLDNITMLLSAILEKLPRVDANDRLLVNTAEQGNVTVALAAAQTLATLTTANDLLRLNNLGTAGVTSRPADAIPLHLSNAGAMHIYDNIKVT
jgi:hypothetical protein